MEKKQVTYVPQGGVCSKQIQVHTAGSKFEEVIIQGGCHGNLQGLSALLRGMDIREAIARLEGIDCRGRGSSCPDQIAQALKQI